MKGHIASNCISFTLSLYMHLGIFTEWWKLGPFGDKSQLAHLISCIMFFTCSGHEVANV